MDPEAIRLDNPPAEASQALEAAAGEADVTSRAAKLREVAAAYPLYLEAWGRLSAAAYEAGDEVASYAFARVGYHRGLDQIRAAGWRGSQQVPYEHPSNRGFLLSLHGLMRAAAAIGEGVEARRCREFLLQLDPADELGVEPIRPAALSRRLPDD